jgi:hypothetical protein
VLEHGVSDLRLVPLFLRQLIHLSLYEDVNRRSDRLRVQLKAQLHFVTCSL